jgi:hypothetical protein
VFIDYRIVRFIDYCLTPSEQYFSYIQDENKFNKKKKNYIEMRQRILATTEKNMESWVGTKISLL